MIKLLFGLLAVMGLFSCNGRLIQNDKGQILCYTNEDQPSGWSREPVRHIPAEYDK